MVEARLDSPDDRQRDDPEAYEEADTDPHAPVLASPPTDPDEAVDGWAERARVPPTLRRATVGATMQPAHRNLGQVVRSVSPTQAVAVALALAFALVILLGAGAAGARIGDLASRRDAALASRLRPADAAIDVGVVLRRFRAMLQADDRFALVLPPDLSIDDAAFDRLLALSMLYPALAVDDRRDADVVVVFGEPSREVRRAFEKVDSAGDVWLGRRRR